MSRTKIFLSLILLSFIAAGTSVFVKLGVQEISPLSFNALRFLFATATLAFLLPKQVSTQAKSKQYYLIPFLLTLNVVLFAFGVQYTSTTAAQILYTGAPILVAVFSLYFLKERISGKALVGILLGLIGVSLVAFFTKSSQDNPATLLGNIIILCAVLSFSLYSVLSRKYLHAYSAREQIMTFSWMTALAMLILSFLADPRWWQGLNYNNLAYTAYAGILGTAGFFVLYQYLVQKSTATIATTTLYLQTFTTYFLAYFVLDERLTLVMFLGMITAIIGSWLATARPKLA